MNEDLTKDVLTSLAQRKPGTSITIAADLANDNLNSICCISLAWICNGNVHGVSYYAKPPAAEFTARKITPAMVSQSPSFADLWDVEIAPLLKGEVLSAYRSEVLFVSIKASYEATRTPFHMDDTYVRDLKFLASTYLADLGNDSLVTILHYMKIPVDLDSTLSRAMACACGIDWLENNYPVSNYGIPLSAIMTGALQSPPPPPPPIEEPPDTPDEEEPPGKYARIIQYTRMGFIPFLILCIVLTVYYMHRYTTLHQNIVDFSKYSATEAPKQEHPVAAGTVFDPDATYIMVRGTYVILDPDDIADFLQAAQDQNMYKIRVMVRAGKIIIFAAPVRIAVTSETDERGFVAVKILEGDYVGTTGYASANMISK
ncbi:MAG: hypothetical protein LKF47_05970 [Megasphaera sp.]|jgi:hypothetical protein|nr:hypothetical protein [Megasphaera sp.]MCI1248814.1 hypothetical protein [Megasphaera sp.]